MDHRLTNRRLRLILSPLLLLLVHCQHSDEVTQSTELEGTWIVVKLNGEAYPKEASLHITGDEARFLGFGQDQAQLRIELDTSVYPKQIDFVYLTRASRILGIYELTGDTLLLKLPKSGFVGRAKDFSIDPEHFDLDELVRQGSSSQGQPDRPGTDTADVQTDGAP